MSLHLSEYLPASVSSADGGLIALVFATTPSTVHLAKTNSLVNTATANHQQEERRRSSFSASTNDNNNASLSASTGCFPSSNENFTILSNTPALSGGAIVDIRAPQLPFANDSAPSLCSMWKSCGPRGRKCCAIVTLSENFDVHVMTCSLDGENILVVFKHSISEMSKWLGERSAAYPSPPDLGLYFSAISGIAPSSSQTETNGNNNNNKKVDETPPSTLSSAPLPRPAMSWFSPSTGALFFVPTVPKHCHAPEERIFWFPFTCLRRPVVSSTKMKKLYTDFDCPILYFTVSEDTETSGGNEVIRFSIVSALSAKHTVRFFCVPNIEVASAFENKPDIVLPDPVILGDFSLASLLSPLAPNYHLSLPSFLNLEGFLSEHHTSNNNMSHNNHHAILSNATIYNYVVRLFTSPIVDNSTNSTNPSSSSSSAISSSSSSGAAASRALLNPKIPLTEDQLSRLLGLAFSTSNSAHPDVFISSLSNSVGPFTFMRIKSSPRGAAITRELSAAAFAYAVNNPDDKTISQGWAAQVLPEQFVGVGLCVCTDQIVHVLECFPKKMRSSSSMGKNMSNYQHQQESNSAADQQQPQQQQTATNKNSNNQEIKELPPNPLFRYSIGSGLPLPHFLGVPFQLPEWANQRLVIERTEMINKSRLPAEMLAGHSVSSSSSSASTAPPPARRVLFVVSKSNDQTKGGSASSSSLIVSSPSRTRLLQQQQQQSSLSSFSSHQHQHHSHERNTANWKYLCLCADNELHEALGVLVPFTGFPSAKIVSRNSGKSQLQRILSAPLESLNSHDQQILFMYTFDPYHDRHLLGNRHHLNSNVRILPSPASEAHPRLDAQTGKIERPLHAAYLFLGKDLALQSGSTAANRCVLFVGMSAMKMGSSSTSSPQFTPSTNHFCVFARQMNELDPRLLEAQQEQAHLNLLHHDGENFLENSSLASFLKKKRDQGNSRRKGHHGHQQEERGAAEIDATFPLGSDFYGHVQRAVVDILSWSNTPFVQYEESKGSVTLLSVDVVDPLVNVNNNNQQGEEETTSQSEEDKNQQQCRTVFYFVRYSVTEEGEDGSMKLGRECCLILVCSIVVHGAILVDDDATLLARNPNAARQRRQRREKEFEQNSKPISVNLKNGAKLQFNNPDFYVLADLPTARNQSVLSDDEDDSDGDSDNDTQQQQQTKKLQVKFSLRLRRVINLSDVTVSISDNVASFKRTRPNKYFINTSSTSSSATNEQQQQKLSVPSSSSSSAKPSSAGKTSANFPAWQVLDLRAFDSSFVIQPLKVETVPQSQDDQTGEPLTRVKIDKVLEVPLSRLYSSPWQDSFEDSIVRSLSCCSSVSRVFTSTVRSGGTSSSKAFSKLYSTSSSTSASTQQQQHLLLGGPSSQHAENAIGATLNFHQLYMYTVRNPAVISSFPGTLVLAWSATARCLLPMLTVHQRENGICCSFPFLLRHEDPRHHYLDHHGNQSNNHKYVGFIRPHTFTLNNNNNNDENENEEESKRNKSTTVAKKKPALNVFDIFADVVAPPPSQQQQDTSSQIAFGGNNNNNNAAATSASSSKGRIISPFDKADSFISLCSPTLFGGSGSVSQSVSGNTFLSDCAIIPEIFGDHSFAVVAASGSELSCVAFWGFSEANSSSSNINRMFLEDHVLEQFEKRRVSQKPISQQANTNNPLIDGEAQTVAPLQETFRGEVKVLWTFDNKSNNNNQQQSCYSAPIMQLTAGQSNDRGACDGPPALFVVALLTNGIVRCHSLTTGAVLWQLGTGASLPMIVRAESAASVSTGSSVCTLPDVIDFCGLSDAPSKSHWVLARIGTLFPSLKWRPEPSSSVLFSWLEWIQWCVTAMATRSQRLRLLKDPSQAVMQHQDFMENNNNNNNSGRGQQQQHVDPMANASSNVKQKANDLLDDMFGGFGTKPQQPEPEPQQPENNVSQQTSSTTTKKSSKKRLELSSPFLPPMSPSQLFFTAARACSGEEESDDFAYSADYKPPQLDFSSPLPVPSSSVSRNEGDDDDSEANEENNNKNKPKNIINEANDLFRNSKIIQEIFLKGLVATLRIAGETVNVSRSILNRCRFDQVNPISPNLVQTKFFVVPSSVAAVLATMSLPLTALALIESSFPSKLFSSSSLNISAINKNKKQKQQWLTSKNHADQHNNDFSTIFENLFSETPSLANFDGSPSTHIFCFATIAFWLEFHGRNEDATIVSLFVLKLFNEFSREKEQEMLAVDDKDKMRPKLHAIDEALSTLLLLTMPPNIASSLNLWNSEFHAGDNFWNKYSVLHKNLNREEEGETSTTTPKENPQKARELLKNAMKQNGVSHLWEVLTLKSNNNNKNNNNNNVSSQNKNNQFFRYEKRFGKQQQILLNRFKTNVTKAFGTVTGAVVDFVIQDVIAEENDYQKNKVKMFEHSSASSGIHTAVTLKEVAACGLQGSQFVQDLDSRLLEEALNLDEKYQDAYLLAKKKEDEFMAEYKIESNDENKKNNNSESSGVMTQAQAQAQFASTQFGGATSKKNKRKKGGKNDDDDDDDNEGKNEMMAIGGAGGLSKIQIKLVDDNDSVKTTNDDEIKNIGDNDQQNKINQEEQPDNNYGNDDYQQTTTSKPDPLFTTSNNENPSTMAHPNQNQNQNQFLSTTNTNQEKQQHQQEQNRNNNNNNNPVNKLNDAPSVIDFSPPALEDQLLDQRVRKFVPHHDSAFASEADNQSRTPIARNIVNHAEGLLIKQEYSKVLQAANKLRNGFDPDDNNAMMQIFLAARVLKLARLEKNAKEQLKMMDVKKEKSEQNGENNNEENDDDDDEKETHSSSSSGGDFSTSNSFSGPSFDGGFGGGFGFSNQQQQKQSHLINSNTIVAADLVRMTALLTTSPCLSNAVQFLLCEKLLPFYIEAKCGRAAVILMSLYRRLIEGQIESGLLSNEEATLKDVKADQAVGAIDGLQGGEFEDDLLEALDGKKTVCVDSLRMLDNDKVVKCPRCMSMYQRHCVCVS